MGIAHPQRRHELKK